MTGSLLLFLSVVFASGLFCYEINYFMKEWSKRILKVEVRTFGAGLIPGLFPWLSKNECIWKPAPFKRSLQLIDWFIILNSFSLNTVQVCDAGRRTFR